MCVCDISIMQLLGEGGGGGVGKYMLYHTIILCYCGLLRLVCVVLLELSMNVS